MIGCVPRSRPDQETQEVLLALTGPPVFQQAILLQVYDLSRPGPEAQKLPRETGNPTLLSRIRNMGG